MFKKVKKENVDITLKEAIEKYAGKNYLSIEYKPNGVVSLWVSSSIIDEPKPKEDGT